MPEVGSTFCGKTVTQVFTGIENMPGVTYSAEWGYSGMPAWCDLYNTGAVTTVTIVDNGIQPVNMDYWFGVGGLKVVSELAQANDLNKIDTAKTTSMFGTFHYSRSLTSIDISSWDTSNVKNMEHMLSECGTTALDISNFDTSSVENMRGMFGASMVLKNIRGISDLDVSNVTDMVFMFVDSISQQNIHGNGHYEFNKNAPRVTPPKWKN